MTARTQPAPACKPGRHVPGCGLQPTTCRNPMSCRCSAAQRMHPDHRSLPAKITGGMAR